MADIRLNVLAAISASRNFFGQFLASKNSRLIRLSATAEGSVWGPSKICPGTDPICILYSLHYRLPWCFREKRSALYGSAGRSTECIGDVDKWMASNRLQLNAAKTEVFWCASDRQQHLLPSDPLLVCGDAVMPAKFVRCLVIGLYLHSDMSMKTHVSRTIQLLCSSATDPQHPSFRQSASFTLSLSLSLSLSLFLSLLISLVLSRLDYSSVNLVGICRRSQDRLQSSVST